MLREKRRRYEPESFALLPGAALTTLLAAVLMTSTATGARSDSHQHVHVPLTSQRDEKLAPSDPLHYWPDGRPAAPSPEYAALAYPVDDDANDMIVPSLSRAPHPPKHYLPAVSWLGLRHSHTHGRNVGYGQPLVGTSWLNRPYYVGGELGPLWITRAPDPSVSRDTDIFRGLFLGWEWDHYWGGELRLDWATPELVNRNAPDAPGGDRLFTWSYSYVYYPWGDAAWRPYYRVGIGNTKVDFPLDTGARHDEWMLAFPFGVGVKYPFRRHIAARMEFTDHLAVGHGRIPTLHNLTLMFGLELRFGVQPKSYWPWHPSRHIW